MKKGSVLFLVCLLIGTAVWASGGKEQKTFSLRYAHMNPPTSIAGIQADMLAKIAAEKTAGAVKIEVFPASQLGGLQEQAEMVANGVVALHHNTMAGIGSLLEEFGALDTPYLYRDVDHLMKVVELDSPIMKQLNPKLIEKRNVRVFYNWYFGSRELTANKAISSPKDLSGMKIRAIPFPIYMAAVEGMGAVAVPVNWAEVPTAIATGVVNGQENPANTILSAKLFEIQSHMMLTGHILGAECVVINEGVWKSFPENIKNAMNAAAMEVAAAATKMTREQEAGDIKSLKEKGMKVIGPAEGLKVEEFRAAVSAFVDKKFGEKYGELYKQIRAYK
jgi:tripartite ATP-independent transporter DctP family solute receptor